MNDNTLSPKSFLITEIRARQWWYMRTLTCKMIRCSLSLKHALHTFDRIFHRFSPTVLCSCCETSLHRLWTCLCPKQQTAGSLTWFGVSVKVEHALLNLLPLSSPGIMSTWPTCMHTCTSRSMHIHKYIRWMNWTHDWRNIANVDASRTRTDWMVWWVWKWCEL